MKQSGIVFSCIIPASKKDVDSQNLKDLIASIKAQVFPQDQIEILVITQGDSEQAKAIGIRRAKGEICAMFCSDNKLMNPVIFLTVKKWFDKIQNLTGYYSHHYFYEKSDNSLNRYFSLIGNNDPIPFYLNKADRRPHYEDNNTTMYDLVRLYGHVPSVGDNGFFVRRNLILKSDLDHYYPMDCFQDIIKKGDSYFLRDWNSYIWHRTSDKLINFLTKRYRYARDLYCDRQDRRWRMVDGAKDHWGLLKFIIFTLTLIQPIWVSIRGFRKVRDFAWFWHPIVCIGFLFTYTILVCRNIIKHQFVFQRSNVKKPLNVALEA